MGFGQNPFNVISVASRLALYEASTMLTMRRAVRQSGGGSAYCMSRLHGLSKLLTRASSSAAAQVVDIPEVAETLGSSQD